MDAAVIDFGRGSPAEAMLPYALLLEAAQHALTKDILKYGAEKGSQSTLDLIAKFLNSNKGYRASDYPTLVMVGQEIVNPKELMVTGGCSLGLSQVCQLFTVPGDAIIVEQPTYFLALEIFKRDHRLKVIPAPLDSNGLRVDSEFEALITKHKPKLLYIIPTHQNPSGSTLSLERRKVLIDLCQKHKVVILADEVYQMISNSDYIPPPPMTFLDTHGCVIGLGTFAKILAPGIRLGWLNTKNQKYLTALSSTGLLLSGGNFNMASGIVSRRKDFNNSAIELGLQQQQLEKYLQVYEERTRFGFELLTQKLGYVIDLIQPNGGYFVWATMKNPNFRVSEDFRSHCKASGVAFMRGEHFYAEPLSCPNDEALRSLRFCFIHWDRSEIEKGITCLEVALSTWHA